MHDVVVGRGLRVEHPAGGAAGPRRSPGGKRDASLLLQGQQGDAALSTEKPRSGDIGVPCCHNRPQERCRAVASAVERNIKCRVRRPASGNFKSTNRSKKVVGEGGQRDVVVLPEADRSRHRKTACRQPCRLRSGRDAHPAADRVLRRSSAANAFHSFLSTIRFASRRIASP